MDIKGKRVVITGGSRGIGVALAAAPGQKAALRLMTGRRGDRAAFDARFAGIHGALVEALRDHTAV